MRRVRLLDAPRVGEVTRRLGRPRALVVIALSLLVCAVAVRAWALYPSWFFLDDYLLLDEARGQALDIGHLTTAVHDRPAPGLRALVWLVSASGPLNWTLAATVTLLLSTLAALALLWLLVTLFGRRPAVLVLVGLYLTTALTAPSLIWWATAAALVPVQLSTFVALGCWVHYLRGHRLRWLAAAGASVVVGLAFDVSAVLAVPLMAYLAAAYFSEGGLLRRVGRALRDHWPGAAVLVLLLAGEVVAQLAAGSRLQWPGTRTVADFAGAMVGTAFPAGALGGPWRWEAWSPPAAVPSTPELLVRLSWVVVALVIAHTALRRRSSLRAWGLLAGYLALSALLLATTLPAVNELAGLDYRLLPGAAGVAVLSLGLASLRIDGSVESSLGREEPLLSRPAPGWAVSGLVLAVAVSGVLSTVGYIRFWHTENASAAYFSRLQADLADRGRVDLADSVVPEPVLSMLATPTNTTRALAPLASSLVRFPVATSELSVVDPTGRVRGALIQTGVTSRPGPVPGCGWKLGPLGGEVPLQGTVIEGGWWMRIGYLASVPSAIEVRAGSSTVRSTIESGLHSLFLQVQGPFERVRLDGLGNDAVLCVDTIEVGFAVPEGSVP